MMVNIMMLINTIRQWKQWHPQSMMFIFCFGTPRRKTYEHTYIVMFTGVTIVSCFSWRYQKILVTIGEWIYLQLGGDGTAQWLSGGYTACGKTWMVLMEVHGLPMTPILNPWRRDHAASHSEGNLSDAHGGKGSPVIPELVWESAVAGGFGEKRTRWKVLLFGSPPNSATYSMVLWWSMVHGSCHL